MANKNISGNGTGESKMRGRGGRRPRARMLAAVGALLILVALGLLPPTSFTASAAPAGQSELAAQAAASVCTEGFYACWMGNDAYWIGQRPLNQVIMPHSHDSGTYGFGAGSYERTQDSDLYHQLVAGARLFDIRAKPSSDGSKLVIYHGDSVSDLDLQSLLDGVAQFTKSPGAERELIYLKISDGGDNNAQLYQHYCSNFTNALGSLVLTPAQLLATDAGAVQAGAEQPFRSLNEIWALPNQPRLMVDWGRCGRSTIQYGDYYANQGSSGCISWADGYALNGRHRQDDNGEPVPYKFGCEGMIKLGAFAPGAYSLQLQVSGPIPGLGTSIRFETDVLRDVESWYRNRQNSAPGYLNYISGDFIDYRGDGLTPEFPLVRTAVELNLPIDGDRYAGGPQITTALLAPVNGQARVELTCHLPSGLGGSLKQLNQPDSADNPQRSTLSVTNPQAGASFQCRDNSNRVARLVLNPVTAKVGPVYDTRFPVSSVPIVFDQPVSNVGLDDFRLTRNGTPVSLNGATLSGSGASYSLDNLTALTRAEGTYQLTLVAFGSVIPITSDSGDLFVADVSESWLVDTTAPTVTIEQAAGQADPTSAAQVRFTIVFSEPVRSFATGDLTIAGTAGATTVTLAKTPGQPVYTATVSGMARSGTVIISLPANKVTDEQGNPNPASTSVDNTVTYNAPPPTVTINQSSGQADPTNAGPITFTVAFSTPVTGFTASDVDLSGSTVGGTLVPTVSGSGTTYQVSVAGMTGHGTVVAAIPAGAAVDTSNNTNVASTSTDNSVTFDDIRPILDISYGRNANGGPVNTVYIAFVEPNAPAEAVTGFDIGDLIFTHNGNPVPLTGATLTPDGVRYTIDNFTALNSAGGDYSLHLITSPGITDAAGNSAISTLSTWTVDVTAPTVTINQANGQADPTNAGPVRFTVVFSEAPFGFSGADISFAGSTAPGTLVATVTGSGTTYQVSVGGMTGSGTVVASVPANAATDAVGNGNTASTSADNSVTFDNVAPTLTLTSTVAPVSNASPIPVTVTFSEAVTGFVAADIVATNGTVANFAGSGTTYTFDLSPNGQGTVTADVAAGVASDAAGNGNSAAAQFTRTYDTAALSAQISAVTPTPRNTPVASVAVAFSKPVTGFDLADLRLVRDGTPVALTGATLTGGGASYTLGNLTGLTGTDGMYTLTLVASGSGIADAASNPLAAAASIAWTVDTIAPTVTIEQAGGQADPAHVGPIRYTVTFSEPVTGFGPQGVTLGGTSGGPLTVAITGGGATYEIAVGGLTADGTLLASIRAGAASDAAGNPSAASTSVDNTVTFQRQAALTVSTQGPGTVSPGTGAYPLGPVTLKATPSGGAVFLGWQVDGVRIGWNTTLSLQVTGPRDVVAVFAARASFSDVSATTPGAEAIAQLAARGIIKGYGNGAFGPNDPIVRAQLAALIVRTFGWDTVSPNRALPFSDIGGIDPELQRAVATLASKGILNGYGDGTFGPTDQVLHIQVISFITRSMVQAGYWQAVTQDDPTLYPNVPLSSGHRLDLLTYTKYAGALPDRASGQAWDDWNQPASRGWTAQALWQALNSFFSTNHLP